MEINKKSLVRIAAISVLVLIALAIMLFIPTTADGWKIVILKDVELLVK